VGGWVGCCCCQPTHRCKQMPQGCVQGPCIERGPCADYLRGTCADLLNILAQPSANTACSACSFVHAWLRTPILFDGWMGVGHGGDQLWCGVTRGTGATRCKTPSYVPLHGRPLCTATPPSHPLQQPTWHAPPPPHLRSRVKVRVSGYRFRVSGYRFRVSGYRQTLNLSPSTHPLQQPTWPPITVPGRLPSQFPAALPVSDGLRMSLLARWAVMASP
jgi:hypothetical protein